MKLNPASRSAALAAQRTLSAREAVPRVLPHSLRAGDTILLNGQRARLLANPYFDAGYGQYFAHVEIKGRGDILPLGWMDIPRLCTG